MSKVIVVVDDNPANLKLLRMFLSKEGYDVRTATDGPEVIPLVERVHPDLILMDIHLPTLDGLEVTRRLKAGDATRDIPVLAVTAYAMKGDDQKARAAGCDEYITKPINMNELLEMVERMCTIRGNTELAAEKPV
jgi:CheY-like chemotaxis protein